MNPIFSVVHISGMYVGEELHPKIKSIHFFAADPDALSVQELAMGFGEYQESPLSRLFLNL